LNSGLSYLSLQDAGRPDAYITSKKIYVSGIKDDHSDEDLRSYFSDFGPVEEVDIIVDKISGQKRGFAFITFEDYDPVDKIVCELQSRLVTSCYVWGLDD